MKISRETVSQIKHELSEIRDGYDLKLEVLQDEFEACSAKCTEYEEQAAEADGSKIADIHSEWRKARETKEFAGGRLRAFWAKYPDADAYLANGPISEEFKAKCQEVDRAVMERLNELRSNQAKAEKEIQKKKAEYLALGEELKSLHDEAVAAVDLGSVARGYLSREERLQLVPSPRVDLLVSKYHLEANLPHLSPGVMFETEVVAGHIPLEVEND